MFDSTVFDLVFGVISKSHLTHKEAAKFTSVATIFFTEDEALSNRSSLRRSRGHQGSEKPETEKITKGKN